MKNKVGVWFALKFKYENLNLVCFMCGLLGNSEQRYGVRFALEEDNGIQKWSSDIKADTMRFGGGGSASRWLKEEENNSRKVDV